MDKSNRQVGQGMHPDDLTYLTEFWVRETNSLNALVDSGFKSAQNHAYAAGFRRGREDLIEVRKQRDALAASLKEIAEAVVVQVDLFRRYGEVCSFEGNSMIYAETLIEIGEKVASVVERHLGEYQS